MVTQKEGKKMSLGGRLGTTLTSSASCSSAENQGHRAAIRETQVEKCAHVFDHLWSHWVISPEDTPRGTSSHILVYCYWRECPLGWNCDLDVATVEWDDTSYRFLLHALLCKLRRLAGSKELKPYPQFMYRYVWGKQAGGEADRNKLQAGLQIPRRAIITKETVWCDQPQAAPGMQDWSAW